MAKTPAQTTGRKLRTATAAECTNRIADAAGTVDELRGQAKLKPIKKVKVQMRIIGTSPLIQHAWDEKAKKTMRDKHAGKKSKDRDVRDPQGEGERAAYYTEDGKFGIPAMALKSAVIGAAHKDIGVEKTLVRKALFLECKDRNNVLPMDCDEPEIHEDCVRVGMGSTDLRYRPYFHRWAVDLVWSVDEELLTVNKLKLPASLRKLFGSTNMIESCYSVTGELCRNVKRWRGENMAMRWAGAMLLETEKRFYRIRGYREMPILAVTLNRIVDIKEAVA